MNRRVSMIKSYKSRERKLKKRIFFPTDFDGKTYRDLGAGNGAWTGRRNESGVAVAGGIKALIWVFSGGQRSVSGSEQRESEVNKFSLMPFTEEEITD